VRSSHGDHLAVVETRLEHDAHRLATSTLADALGRAAPPGALSELRDLVVAMLVHHHRSEDDDLWPLLAQAAPDLTEPLGSLSEEHRLLDAALDRLGAPAGDVTDPGVRQAAVAVRDLVYEHLAREEPVLFPALRRHMSSEAWSAFSARVVASAPQEGQHLHIGLLYEVGAPEEVRLVLRHLPPEAQDLVPAMREQARATFAALRTAPPVVTNSELGATE
jgi:hypothetical protein